MFFCLLPLSLSAVICLHQYAQVAGEDVFILWLLAGAGGNYNFKMKFKMSSLLDDIQNQ
jgi:hypothetical protein